MGASCGYSFYSNQTTLYQKPTAGPFGLCPSGLPWPGQWSVIYHLNHIMQTVAKHLFVYMKGDFSFHLLARSVLSQDKDMAFWQHDQKVPLQLCPCIHTVPKPGLGIHASIFPREILWTLYDPATRTPWIWPLCCLARTTISANWTFGMGTGAQQFTTRSVDLPPQEPIYQMSLYLYTLMLCFAFISNFCFPVCWPPSGGQQDGSQWWEFDPIHG